MPPLPTLLSLLVLLSLCSLSVDGVLRFAVTELSLVYNDSFAGAVETCQAAANAVAVGVDWANRGNAGVLLLCVKRERIEEIASSTLLSMEVIQRVAVYTDKTKCPASETALFHPQKNVIVCVRRAVATAELLASGNFLSDLWVSSNRNYNSDVPGWTQIPVSVRARADEWYRHLWQKMWTPSYRGAFISYQKPLLPIQDLKILPVPASSGNSGDLHSVCTDVAGESWEQVGSDVMGKGGSQSVLCLRRSNTGSAALTNATVVKGADAACPLGFSSVKTPLPASLDATFCLQWSTHHESEDALVDLRLVATNGDKTLPGNYQRTSTVPLSGSQGPRRKHVYLYAQRSWATITDDQASAGLDSRPPLVARTDTRADGAKGLSFKILQLPDLHFSGNPKTKCKDTPSGMKKSECTEAFMTQFVNELLDLEKPDFVAFTGDNVELNAKKRRQQAVDAVVEGVEARGIPHGVVFGNHDDERGFNRDTMMTMYMKKPHSYSRRGPRSVDGVGNYELNIQSPSDGVWGKQGANVFRMYFIDSLGYPDKATYPDNASKYDWIKPSQIAYYRQLSAQHAAEKNTVPAIMFFHIPLPEYALYGKSLRSGDHLEKVMPSSVNTNMFASLVELNEVKATFCGHDHINDYCYKREGVQLCYGGGAGFGTAYGSSSVARRARVIEWSVDGENRRTIRSWKRLLGSLQTKQGEEVLFTEAI